MRDGASVQEYVELLSSLCPVENRTMSKVRILSKALKLLVGYVFGEFCGEGGKRWRAPGGWGVGGYDMPIIYQLEPPEHAVPLRPVHHGDVPNLSEEADGETEPEEDAQGESAPGGKGRVEYQEDGDGEAEEQNEPHGHPPEVCARVVVCAKRPRPENGPKAGTSAELRCARGGGYDDIALCR